MDAHLATGAHAARRGARLPPRAALALALELPARLRAGAGRVELQFALAGLPLALRFAGLDRDPGWLPAAGSDIRFRFD
ncbi:MAG: hypothetical protein KIT35_18420 [Piscinibacter sp.]|uniref:hypothetical protein n=1 Tax=Piscinibacter sp. TaxID=1903157 RepID=UPI0025840336|nr:hypothetical protein [Piscinibacter sp.]MCW5665809.1 hypothetical protein [Piscinibacter sp.]